MPRADKDVFGFVQENQICDILTRRKTYEANDRYYAEFAADSCGF